MASIEGAVSEDESGTDKDALSSDPSADGAGVSKLTDGTEELGGGAAELLDGKEELGGGSAELLDCTEELGGGAAELLGCTAELDREAVELMSGGTDDEFDTGLLEEEFDELTILLARVTDEDESTLDIEELFELLLEVSEWLVLSAAPVLSMSLVRLEQPQTKRQSRTEKIHRIRLTTGDFFFISNTSHTAYIKL